jgi:hypothetical protein
MHDGFVYTTPLCFLCYTLTLPVASKKHSLANTVKWKYFVLYVTLPVAIGASSIDLTFWYTIFSDAVRPTKLNWVCQFWLFIFIFFGFVHTSVFSCPYDISKGKSGKGRYATTTIVVLCFSLSEWYLRPWHMHMDNNNNSYIYTCGFRAIKQRKKENKRASGSYGLNFQ